MTKNIMTLTLALLATQVFGAVPFEIDNTDCVGDGDPYACCSGAGTGTCDGKGVWVVVANRFLFAEGCAAFWYSETCGHQRDVNGDGARTQWLVDLGVCSAEEASVGVPLKTRAADCTAEDEAVIDGQTIAVPWCTGAGTSDGSEHVQTCDATAISNNRCQGSGTWDFTGSDIMPKAADCAKAFNAWFKSALRLERNQGRLNWENLIRGDFPESTDPLE